MPTARIYDRPLTLATRITLLMLIAIAGLFYVKWMPYYHKAFLAADNHSIGKSILMGTAAQAPPASWHSAIDYALAYGKAIWQAMVLGLLLGSAIQEFAPRAWIARQLGRSDVRSVTLGGLLAMPAMMCTCCAAPVVIGLRRANASAAAAVAFWLGQYRAQSRSAGLHGIRVGMEMGWPAPCLGDSAGLRHRISHQPLGAVRGHRFAAQAIEPGCRRIRISDSLHQ